MITTADILQFNVYASTCGFNKDTGNYDSRFLFRWDMDHPDSVYTGRTPRFRFTTPGLRHVALKVTDDQTFVSRRETLTVQVNAP